MVDQSEVEQFGALASNWREAQEIDDAAASEAFENELHERITMDEVKVIQGFDATTGEPSPAETDRLRTVLGTMWNNASARLD